MRGCDSGTVIDGHGVRTRRHRWELPILKLTISDHAQQQMHPGCTHQRRTKLLPPSLEDCRKTRSNLVSRIASQSLVTYIPRQRTEVEAGDGGSRHGPTSRLLPLSPFFLETQGHKKKLCNSIPLNMARAKQSVKPSSQLVHPVAGRQVTNGPFQSPDEVRTPFVTSPVPASTWESAVRVRNSFLRSLRLMFRHRSSNFGVGRRTVRPWRRRADPSNGARRENLRKKT